MRSVRWNLKCVSLTWAVVTALAACSDGGGSGGGGGGGNTATVVTLSGNAAKGALAHAVVTAHAIKSDGSEDPAVLASAETDDTGHYTNLSFNAIKDAPYVIKITAKSGGATTQLDEVTGLLQPMPADFSMRSLFIPSVGGLLAATASITPFSEMAVAAAARGNNGITAANAAQALTNVVTLLGFNPANIRPTTIADATPGEQQKLALLLTAVSRLANDSALGCTATDAGIRAKCVVDTLASTSTLQSTIPGSTAANANVATALSGAILAVAANTQLTGGKVDATTLTSTLNTLANPGTPIPAANNVAPIASAKLLFTSLKSDVTSLISDRNATPLGAANVEANTFIAASKGVQLPAEMLIKDVGALVLGIDLYNDFKAGRETRNFRDRGRNFGLIARSFNQVGSTRCELYTDNALTIPATSPANALYIGCHATYHRSIGYASGNAFAENEWRHRFVITPTSNVTFGYETSAREEVQTTTCGNAPCTTVVNSSVLVNNADGRTSTPYSGTMSVTIGTDPFTTSQIEGHITGFSLNGKLPGAFKSGTNTLTNNHHDVALNGTRTFDKDATGRAFSVTKLSGSLTAFADDSSTLGTLTINSGSLTATDIFATTDGSSESKETAGSLDLKWTTAKSEVAGILSVPGPVYDINNDKSFPSKVEFTGALRNQGSDGAFADFISGRITGIVTGYERFNGLAPLSASNDYTTSISFVVGVTAPGRPKLELSGNVSSSQFTRESKTSSVQYRTLAADGTPRQVIDISITPSTSTAPSSFKFSEAASNLSMTVVKGAATTDLLYNNMSRVGTFNSATKLLTFTNGDFISLDAGT